MNMDANRIVVEALQDKARAKTAAFSAKLTPTVAPERFLGVKSADMKAACNALLTGKLSVSAEEFRAAVPHPYVELDMVHVRTLNALQDPEKWRAACEDFLPFVDNWMVTDSFDPALLRGQRAIGSDGAAAVIKAGRDWLTCQAAGNQGVQEEIYTIRAGVIVLLQALKRGHFSPEQLEWVVAVRHPYYYVHMAVGWYFATAFDKYENESRTYLEENGRLQLEAHLCAVQKIIESRRTSVENLAWARDKRAELRRLAKSK